MSKEVSYKGILGFKRNPKQPILFGIHGEMWPSDDSEDSDFVPEEQQWNKNVTAAFPANSKVLPKPDVSFVPPAINYSDCVSSNGENSETEPPSFQVSSTRVNGLTFSLLVPGIKRLDNVQEKGHKLHSHKSKKSKKKKKRLEDKEEKRERKKRKHDSVMMPDETKKKRKKHKKSKKKDMDMLIGNGHENSCLVPDIEGPWGTVIPENVLEKIFSYIATADGALPFLPRMCRVCKLWNRVAQLPNLWVNMDFSWGRVRTSEILLIKLCLEDRLTFTRELNLAGWGSSLTQKGIEAIVTHCRFLTTINLSRCVKILADCIRLLADNCPKLSSIDLSGTCKRHNGASPVSPASIRHLVKKCGERLTRLYLAENDVAGFTTIIKSISESCPNLQVLDLSNLQCRSQSAVLPLEDLQRGCPRLRVLRLANSSVTLASTSLTEQAQSQGFPNVEELSIAVENGVGMGDNDLERLLKTSHKVRLLDVRGCRNISVSGLIRIPAWDIQHLYLSQCAVTRKQDLELVLQKWGRSLKEIDLSRAINEEAINLGMAALAATEEECPLKALDLSGSAVSYNTIKLLLSKCTHLDTLNLQSCRSLPRGMKRLYTKDDLIRLHEDIDEGRFAESLPVEI